MDDGTRCTVCKSALLYHDAERGAYCPQCDGNKCVDCGHLHVFGEKRHNLPDGGCRCEDCHGLADNKEHFPERGEEKSLKTLDRSYLMKAITSSPLLPPPGDAEVAKIARSHIALWDELELATAEIQRLGSLNDTNTIAAARRTMWAELEADPDFRLTYEANIAMLMYDELHTRGYTPKFKPDDRNEIAARLLKLIFGP